MSLGIETLNNELFDSEEDKEIRSKYLARLADIEDLEYNWDGDGALPVSPIVLKTVKDILLKIPPRILDFWILFPELNGTLLFSARQKYVMGLSIGGKSSPLSDAMKVIV